MKSYEIKKYIKELVVQRKAMSIELDHFGAGDLQILFLNNVTYHIDNLIKHYSDLEAKYNE